MLGAIGAYLNENDVNRVVDSLTKTLKDRYEEIRKVTVTSMNRLAWAAMLGFEKVVVEGVIIERVVTSLIEASKDPKEDVRIEAIKAVGGIGTNLIMEEKKEGKQIVNCLIEALEDENEYVRCKVVESLGEILLATESYNSVNEEIIVAMEKLEKKE